MAITRSDLIRSVQQYAAQVRGPVTVKRFCRHARCCPTTLYQLFKGGFPELLAAAKLTERASRAPKHTEESLLKELHRLARLLHRDPRPTDVNARGRFALCNYYVRFGRWKHVLLAYKQWRRRGTTPAPTSISPELRSPLLSSAKPEPTPDHKHLRGLPMGFRNLLHGPVNELGVIHLFGMLWRETGLAIEHIGPSFPDCRALKLDLGTGRWRPITVEFELRSSNFRQHGHNIKKCNLIVCWEDDWPDCPIQVMELKSLVEQLQSAPPQSLAA